MGMREPFQIYRRQLYHLHWSGGSGISQTQPAHELGAKTYYLTRFLPKSAWKWKKLDREGDASLAPSRSANVFYQYYGQLVEINLPRRFCFRLCGNQKPEEKIVSTNEEMLLAFRSNWDYEFYHARKGFKAVIRAGNYFYFTFLWGRRYPYFCTSRDKPTIATGKENLPLCS